MPPRSPSLVAGLRIGGYGLVRRIGCGGMAEVWCAKRVSERRTSKFVAIKVVADQYVGDPRFQRMFRAEAELSGLLNHANIVQVFDEGEDDGRSYLVMEWVDGVNLLKVAAALTFIDDAPERYKIVSYIVGQLLYALGYAHGITLHDGNPLGIVHRDVSPQNVLVSNHGEVKLTDFGVAHHLLEESSGMHVKGKVRYMAPEQLGGQTRDPRIDLYAVGAILHELLDGRRFRHHVEDQRAMYIEVLSGKVPTLSRIVPPELDTLRLALLQPDPKDRPPNAESALGLLERFPGYGDARRDLMQLCAGLTGVLRPRVGPGTSRMYASASASPEAIDRPSRSPTPAAPSASIALGPGPVTTPPNDPIQPTASPSAPVPSPFDAEIEPTSPHLASARSARQPSITLRLTADDPGAPQPIFGDTSPLPPPAAPRRGTGAVRGEIDDTVGGSGALIGGGAQRGTPYDVPPDTAVMTSSVVRRLIEPIGPEDPNTDPQHDASTLASIGSHSPASSPGSTMVAPRSVHHGTSVMVLVVVFLLGSVGTLAAFLLWGDTFEEPANEILDAHPTDEAMVRPLRERDLPISPPDPSGSTGPESSGGTADSMGCTMGGTSETTSEGSGTAGESTPPQGEAEPSRSDSPRPKQYSGLIVAVDGKEPLLVRVGNSEPKTIESRRSWTFRALVGERRRVRWKRSGDAAWNDHWVPVRAKCELQLRLPSKTLTLGSCR